jgi:hypothetical protein
VLFKREREIISISQPNAAFKGGDGSTASGASEQKQDRRDPERRLPIHAALQGLHCVAPLLITPLGLQEDSGVPAGK